ncbi:16S rRNA (cytosine(967)-C(5))-methyltransferase RsmB [Isoalcanivorax indicus]|uniref:16S rRNA (cytosine(967)-C(5))-methyltransferase RsmB n=1 Tax=Isoalcanivorax indicus TaxID=2202653 RepID=UPI000DBACD32|nr:16S rRNA (cytosine(967)-C(5))-methyltransferase RsmB [Isoalcanivorax indicus]
MSRHPRSASPRTARHASGPRSAGRRPAARRPTRPTDPRHLAVVLLGEILPADEQGRSLREALGEVRDGLSPADRGLVSDLCFGVCRHYRLLDHWLDSAMDKPLKPSARGVRLALLCGLYELWFTERPAHAVVNAYPDLCRTLNAPWAAGLSNALLRKAGRTEIDEVRAALPVAIACSLPDWLWQQWCADWGDDQATAMARASIVPAPMTLRGNRLHGDAAALAQRLEAAGLPHHAGSLAPYAFYLDEAVPVNAVPGFNDGVFSVQDEAAQLPAELIDAPDDGRLLDACAAPGGKTGQLAERFPGATLIALDNDAARLDRVRSNLARLGANATVLAGDAVVPSAWWDGTPFDAILLDAPCSATGILRRQPDVKWHRRATDLPTLAGLQARMLDALWPLIRPGGLLVYATCSTLTQENAAQVSAFLARQGDARDDTAQVSGDVAVQAGAQWLPREGGHDGFYLARLRKAD